MWVNVFFYERRRLLLFSEYRFPESRLRTGCPTDTPQKKERN